MGMGAAVRAAKLGLFYRLMQWIAMEAGEYPCPEPGSLNGHRGRLRQIIRIVL